MNPIFLSARPLENHNYKIYDTLGIKRLNRLRLSFSHLKERKFEQNFAGTINPFVHVMFLVPWNRDNFPFFLPCRNNTIYRTIFMNKLSNADKTIPSLKQNDLINTILYGEKNFVSNNNQSMMGTKTLIENSNQSILNATIQCIRYTKRFNESLFWAIFLTILDNPVYKILFKNPFILLFF